MRNLLTTIMVLAAFSVFGQKVIKISDLITTADLKLFEAPRVDSLPSGNYLVSWDLVERYPLPTEYRKETDAVGRVTYNTHAVYRYKEFFNHQEKIFKNREEAFRFYESAKKEYDIRNVVIDSMYYKLDQWGF